MIGANRSALASNDIVTRRLETINLSSAGALSPIEGSEIAFEPLIQSSSDAMLMDASLLEDVLDPSVLFDEFVSANERYTIAARLSGVFATAFPEGRPLAAGEADSEVGEGSEDASTEPDEAGAGSETDSETDAAELSAVGPLEGHIAQTEGPSNILIFADTDVLSDRLWVQISQFFGQRIPQPFANNGDFVINALDNMSGGADLVSIRSRGRYSRPFDRVVKMQRAADDRLRTEEAALLERLEATEAQIAELNLDENGEPLLQLSPEAQAEVDRFNEDLLETRRSLRDVQFQLTSDIEALGANLKWLNTLAVPMLLTLLALFVSFLRAQRRRAAGQ
jgi:ABC-type uncharacterized transport system involved in gliding motility auxiliary subunit